MERKRNKELKHSAKSFKISKFLNSSSFLRNSFLMNEENFTQFSSSKNSYIPIFNFEEDELSALSEKSNKCLKINLDNIN